MPKLSKEYLETKGFNLCPGNAFEEISLSYYAKDAVLLFFNEPITIYNKNDFLIGYGAMRQGKNSVVTFRWIKSQEQVEEIYKAIIGKVL